MGRRNEGYFPVSKASRLRVDGVRYARVTSKWAIVLFQRYVRRLSWALPFRGMEGHDGIASVRWTRAITGVELVKRRGKKASAPPILDAAERFRRARLGTTRDEILLCKRAKLEA